MAAASPVPSQTASADGAVPTGLGRAIDITARLATSWVGLLTAYAGAVTAAVFAFQKLKEPLAGVPLWARVAIVAALPVLALVFHTIPTLIEQRRRKHLTEITGHLQAGYFRLAPREDEASFTRADGKHQEILRWLQQSSSPVLYLTGLSGSGKSSLLAAFVLPNLERENTVVIRLRGYQDPVAVLEHELRLPGVVWKKAAPETTDLPSLLERASQYLRPRRLLMVLDQFEEFVILQDPGQHERFNQLMSALRERPIDGVSFLFVFRSDYIGVIEKLALPGLNQDTNWKEVPPFMESAARDFMRGSGLQVGDELLGDVLREAAEIEQTKGLIRPITINLCGLVLGRFATGLPRGFRPGQLIRGFLRESVLLPSIRDIAPRIVPQLISSYVTKRPRTVDELAKDTALEAAEVRGCLRILGQSDRAIVRPLDAEQQTWEISHDFLVPLLDSIVARWSVSLWRRTRLWLPWVAAGCMVATVIIAANWRRDPIVELEAMGWGIQKIAGRLFLEFDGPPPKGSVNSLRRIHDPLYMKISEVDASVADWRALNNLYGLEFSSLKGLGSFNKMSIGDISVLKDLRSLLELDLSDTNVSDVSPLKDLKNLTSLDLAGTQVRDVSPLKDLTNLTTLNLSGTHVGDLSPLKDLTNLTTLNLIDTKVSDVSPLRALTNLTTLDLQYTKVSDVSPLKDLTNLTTLNLIDTKVSDVSPLRDLTKLTTLDLSATQVSDVSPLKDLKSLTALSLSDTKVSDVSPLRDLKHLTYLELRGTPVSDVSPLKGLKNLSTLDLQGTMVTDVSPLKDLQSLTALNLAATPVSDVSPLKDLKNLHIEGK